MRRQLSRQLTMNVHNSNQRLHRRPIHKSLRLIIIRQVRTILMRHQRYTRNAKRRKRQVNIAQRSVRRPTRILIRSNIRPRSLIRHHRFFKNKRLPMSRRMKHLRMDEFFDRLFSKVAPMARSTHVAISVNSHQNTNHHISRSFIRNSDPHNN